jgi:hypothetical protein
MKFSKRYLLNILKSDNYEKDSFDNRGVFTIIDK